MSVGLKDTNANTSNFRTSESMKLVKHDSLNYYFEYPSANESFYTSDKKTSSPIKVVLRKKKGEWNIINDYNLDGRFVEKSFAIDTAKKVSFRNRFYFYQDEKFCNKELNFSIRLEFDTSSNPKLFVQNSNTVKTEFKISEDIFHIEFMLSRLRNLYALPNINISNANSPLSKIDWKSTLMYRLRKDTIIKNSYEIIIDSVNKAGDKAFLRFRLTIEKDIYGYLPNYKIKNFSLVNLDDLKLDSLYDVIANKKFVLLDLWGSWCIPCIKNFPKLKEFKKRVPLEYFDIIGLDYENKSNLKHAKEILRSHEVDWKNYFIDQQDSNSIVSSLKVYSFPTYILLDENGSILFRENSEGLENILNFILKNQNKLH